MRPEYGLFQGKRDAAAEERQRRFAPPWPVCRRAAKRRAMADTHPSVTPSRAEAAAETAMLSVRGARQRMAPCVAPPRP